MMPRNCGNRGTMGRHVSHGSPSGAYKYPRDSPKLTTGCLAFILLRAPAVKPRRSGGTRPARTDPPGPTGQPGVMPVGKQYFVYRILSGLEGSPSRGATHGASRRMDRQALMSDEREPPDDFRDPDLHQSVIPELLADTEAPETATPADAFLRSLPGVIHELSEALSAISAYLAGGLHLCERGDQSDRIQFAIERASTQAGRANDTVKGLRDGITRLGRSSS